MPLPHVGQKGPHRQVQELKRENEIERGMGQVGSTGTAVRLPWAASSAAICSWGPLQGQVLLRKVPLGAGLHPTQVSLGHGGQQLPGALQLLPQPGGQRLPHLVQELGELYVMVPVIVPQEGARLQRENTEEGQGTSPKPITPAWPPGPAWDHPMRPSAYSHPNPSQGTSSLCSSPSIWFSLHPEADTRILSLDQTCEARALPHPSCPVHLPQHRNKPLCFPSLHRSTSPTHLNPHLS